ncbi:MAG: trypsin-like peptidase domain-containing protein [Oscillospiraceae bacterium]|nr:trypsin-like peptidase domain-containing protein [Oscillospiraceae bacterium]
MKEGAKFCQTCGAVQNEQPQVQQAAPPPEPPVLSYQETVPAPQQYSPKPQEVSPPEQPAPPTQAAVPLASMYCSKCGSELKAGSKFCPACGTAQNEQPQVQQTAPPVQQYATQSQQAAPPLQQAVPPAKKKGKTGRIVAIIVIALVAIGVIGYFFLDGGNDTGTTTPDITAGDDTRDVAATEPAGTEILTGAQIFARNRDAVIIIRTYLGDGIRATGSGFFVDSSGIAVTNHHVLDGAISAIAILYDGREFDITGFYSYDIENDLAVIQVDGRGLSFDYVTLGNSDATVVGEDVFAIGGPDWDPITFTPGMISRIAYEHVPFGTDSGSVYHIAGMFQSTAAIYGGNSGGPLVNDRGQVIGVNAAGNRVRASVQFAVPINRVVLPATGATVNTLPIGGMPAPPQHTPGQIFVYERFPFIPDFMSVSRYGSFALSGTPANLGLSPGDILYDLYDYVYIYELPLQHSDVATEAFAIALFENGFILQDVVIYETEAWSEAWAYFFHPGQNVSLSYAYWPSTDTLFIAVVQGNVYERFYNVQTPMTEPPAPVTSQLAGTIWYVNMYMDIGYGVFNYDVYLEFLEDGMGWEDYIWVDGDWDLEVPFAWSAENGVLTRWFDIDGQVMELSGTYMIIGDTLTLFIDGDMVTLERW